MDEGFEKRAERHLIIRKELKDVGVSDLIIGGIRGERYTVRCQICGWREEADNAQDAAKIGWQHDVNRVKWGCPVGKLNGKNKSR
jgi:hypothetical protein